MQMVSMQLYSLTEKQISEHVVLVRAASGKRCRIIDEKVKTIHFHVGSVQVFFTIYALCNHFTPV